MPSLARHPLLAPARSSRALWLKQWRQSAPCLGHASVLDSARSRTFCFLLHVFIFVGKFWRKCLGTSWICFDFLGSILELFLLIFGPPGGSWAPPGAPKWAQGPWGSIKNPPNNFKNLGRMCQLVLKFWFTFFGCFLMEILLSFFLIFYPRGVRGGGAPNYQNLERFVSQQAPPLQTNCTLHLARGKKKENIDRIRIFVGFKPFSKKNRHVSP